MLSDSLHAACPAGNDQSRAQASARRHEKPEKSEPRKGAGSLSVPLVKPIRESDSQAGQTEAKPAMHPEASKRVVKADGKNQPPVASAKEGHRAAAKEGHRASDKPSGGRSGQKRSRSRSPEKQERRSRMANGDGAGAKQERAPDAKKPEAKSGTVRNGKTDVSSKVSDPESRKEWSYSDDVRLCL